MGEAEIASSVGFEHRRLSDSAPVAGKERRHLEAEADLDPVQPLPPPVGESGSPIVAAERNFALGNVPRSLSLNQLDRTIGPG